MRSDLVLMENDCHKMYLSKLGSFEHVINLPNILFREDLQPAFAKLDEIDLKKKGRPNLAYYGNFEEACDFDNLQYTLSEIWPRFLDLDQDYKLHVFGTNIDKRVLDVCASTSRVRVIVSKELLGVSSSSEI